MGTDEPGAKDRLFEDAQSSGSGVPERAGDLKNEVECGHMGLKTTLEDFQTKVNENQRIEKILKGWAPHIFVEPRGTNERYTMIVADSKITAVLEGRQEADHLVHLSADPQIMNQVFSGELNPSEAVLDGILSVFASDKDQVKLDAISLVLWGA
jgi:hypothetical protein